MTATEEQLHKQRTRLKVYDVKKELSFITGVAKQATKETKLNKDITKRYDEAYKLLNEIEEEFVNE